MFFLCFAALFFWVISCYLSLPTSKVVFNSAIMFLATL